MGSHASFYFPPRRTLFAARRSDHRSNSKLEELVLVRCQVSQCAHATC